MSLTTQTFLDMLKEVCPNGFDPRVDQAGIDAKWILYFYKEVDLMDVMRKDEAAGIVAKIQHDIEDMVRQHPIYQKLLEMHVNETESLKEDIGQLESENERLRKFETHYSLEHNLRHGGNKHEINTMPSDKYATRW